MDANFIMTPDGDVIEVQATSEDKPTPWDEFIRLKVLANQGAENIAKLQQEAIAQAS